MLNIKILVEVDRVLAERFLDLANKGAFGSGIASSSVTLNKLVSKLIHKAIIAGEKKLLGEQKRADQARELKAPLEAMRGIQSLRFTRERRVA